MRSIRNWLNQQLEETTTMLAFALLGRDPDDTSGKPRKGDGGHFMPQMKFERVVGVNLAIVAALAVLAVFCGAVLGDEHTTEVLIGYAAVYIMVVAIVGIVPLVILSFQIKPLRLFVWTLFVLSVTFTGIFLWTGFFRQDLERLFLVIMMGSWLTFVVVLMLLSIRQQGMDDHPRNRS